MLERAIPCITWLKNYRRQTFINDLMAAVVVTVMLIPQSLAYALLAGLPPEMGLYTSILPLIVYALLSSSRTLSVGPVAVISLMTATSVGAIAQQGTADYATTAIMLALLNGLILIVLGLLRFGFVTNFLSHPMISGLITASGIIIIFNQLQHILGIKSHGNALPGLSIMLAEQITATNVYTLCVGLFSLLFLMFCRNRLGLILIHNGLNRQTAGLITKSAPIAAIVLTILATILWDLESYGVALVGHVPRGLPAFSMPMINIELIEQLAVPALLISLIGFVESVSIGKSLGAKRRQRINSNQELIGLGAANIASSFSGGFPVAGGLARSVVNFDAGAETQAASIMTAIGIAITAVLLTPILYFLPKATLAATIIIAVTNLIDLSIIKEAWRFSQADFIIIAMTIGLTLLLGVEIGVISGVVASIGIHLYKTTRPHFAIVGTIPGTEHYRNIKRHKVITYPNVLSIRIDESLYFANADYIDEIIYRQLSERKNIEHVVLMCSAVNEIDLSALDVLEEINQHLSESGISLHLSEVKGPVMDYLKQSHFLKNLSGKIYLNHHAAVLELAKT